MIVHGFVPIRAMYRLELVEIPGSCCAQVRYRTPLLTNVEASSEKVSHGVVMRPRSVQAPVNGLALELSSTYIRIRQTSSLRPAAK